MNIKFLEYILFLSYTIALCVCIQNTDAVFSQEPTKQYLVNSYYFELKKGPSINSDRILNINASKILNETIYISVDTTVNVVVLEKQQSWCKIKVVEPYYLAHSHVGWIPSNLLVLKNKRLNK